MIAGRGSSQIRAKEPVSMLRPVFGCMGVGAILIVAGGMIIAKSAPPYDTPVAANVSPDDDSDPQGPGVPLSWSSQHFGAPNQPLGPVAVGFAQGTDPSIVQFVTESLQSDPMQRYQLTNRWSGATGTPRALTWSFAPDGINIPGGVGEPA